MITLLYSSTLLLQVQSVQVRWKKSWWKRFFLLRISSCCGSCSLLRYHLYSLSECRVLEAPYLIKNYLSLRLLHPNLTERKMKTHPPTHTNMFEMDFSYYPLVLYLFFVFVQIFSQSSHPTLVTAYHSLYSQSCVFQAALSDKE